MIVMFRAFVDDFQGSHYRCWCVACCCSDCRELRDLPYRKGSSTAGGLPRRMRSCWRVPPIWATPSASASTRFTPSMTVSAAAARRRSVPLLSYHEWCEGFSEDQMRIAKPVIDLIRERPSHPSPRIPGTWKRAVSKPSNRGVSSRRPARPEDEADFDQALKRRKLESGRSLEASKINKDQ